MVRLGTRIQTFDFRRRLREHPPRQRPAKSPNLRDSLCRHSAAPAAAGRSLDRTAISCARQSAPVDPPLHQIKTQSGHQRRLSRTATAPIACSRYTPEDLTAGMTVVMTGILPGPSTAQNTSCIKESTHPSNPVQTSQQASSRIPALSDRHVEKATASALTGSLGPGGNELL